MSRSKQSIVGPFQKKTFYALSILLWLSGALWLYPRVHPVRSILLQIHGAAAMGFLIVFGLLLVHMKPGWRHRRQRLAGASLLVVCGFLILTGWGLYYVGNESFRNFTGSVHSLLGLLLPLIIVFHLWMVRTYRT